jgi:hypothetical protein
MAKGNTARFAQNPRNFDAVITTAIQNLNTDAPTGAVLLVTAGAFGAIVPRMGAMLRASLATGAGIVLFRSNNQGATLRPKGSITMPAQTVGATTGLTETDFPKFSEQRPLRLGPNEQLWVGSMVQPPVGGIVIQGDIVDFITND